MGAAALATNHEFRSQIARGTPGYPAFDEKSATDKFDNVKRDFGKLYYDPLYGKEPTGSDAGERCTQDSCTEAAVKKLGPLTFAAFQR
jgi:hypothetical protein